MTPTPVDHPLIDVIPDAIIIHDDGGTILDVNRRTCEALERDYDDLVGQTVWDIAVDPEPASVKARWAALEPGESAAFDGEHERADGSSFPVWVHVGRLDGDDPRFLAAVRDVSDREARERELERQNERLERFASIVSHDLRNPMTVVAGRIRLAKETGDLDHLDRAQEALDRMERMISDLLTMARKGETVADPEPVDLAAAIASCWEFTGTPGATLAVDTDRTVMADPDRLRQLLENVLRNAAEHGGDGVTVRVGDIEGGFFVEDDGPGIPSAERERVFEAGYTTSETGTGLGLAIVRDLADAHGWEVRLGEGPAGGARLEFIGVGEAG